MQLPGIIYICSGVVAQSKVVVRLKIALATPAYELGKGWADTLPRIQAALPGAFPFLLLPPPSPSEAPEEGQ